MGITNRFIIAIDGPAASGKSTTAKLLAQKMGYIYLDSGAMYRVCALAALQAEIAHSDILRLQNLMDEIELRIEYCPSGNRVILYNADVTARIREEDISRLASDISTLKPVRDKMVFLQRKMGESGGVVMDGRDIGTVVFPQAEFKFFMVATAAERAKRRLEELAARGIQSSYEAVYNELVERDKQDSTRALAPLKPAADAIMIDTTSLSIGQQVQYLYEIIQKKLDA
jgi:cytidylate kinase